MNDKVRFTEKTIKTALRNAALHHIESFNYAADVVLPRICQNLLAAEIAAPQESENKQTKTNPI